MLLISTIRHLKCKFATIIKKFWITQLNAFMAIWYNIVLYGYFDVGTRLVANRKTPHYLDWWRYPYIFVSKQQQQQQYLKNCFIQNLWFEASTVFWIDWLKKRLNAIYLGDSCGKGLNFYSVKVFKYFKWLLVPDLII